MPRSRTTAVPTPDPSQATETPSRLVARTMHLREGTARLVNGSGTIVLGAPGIGKTALVDALAERATRLGRRVGHVTATATSASVPFGVLLRLVDGAGIERVMSAADADPLHTAAMIRAQVLDLDLDVLVIDDAHLLDSGSLAFVLELVDVGVVLLAALRPDGPASTAFLELSRGWHTTLVELDDFTLGETMAMAAAVLGVACEPTLGALLHRRSGGKPLVLRELVREGLSSGSIVIGSGIARSAGVLPAVPHLAVLLGLRVELLTPPLRRLVETVAVADQTPLDVAMALAGEDVLDEAEKAGWLTVDIQAESVRMRGPVLQDALRETIGPVRRRSHLRRLVDTVEHLDRPLTIIERVGLARWHLDLGLPLDAATALEAASITGLTDPALSERLLRAAIDAGAGVSAEVRLAGHLKRTGRSADAAVLLGRARTDGLDAATLDEVSVMLAIIVGIGFRRSREALIALEGQIAPTGPSVDQRAVRAALLWREGRLLEALDEASDVAAAEEASFAAVFGGINEVLIRASHGQRAAALHRLQHLQPLVLGTLDRVPEGPTTLRWLAAYVPLLVDLDSRAMSIARVEYDHLLERGEHAERAQFAYTLALDALLAGRPGDAVALLRDCEAAPGIWRDSWYPTIGARLVEALLLSGDADGARRRWETLRASHSSPVHRPALRLAEAALLAADGDRVGAGEVAASAALAALRAGDLVAAFDAACAGVRYGSTRAAEVLAATPLIPESPARLAQRLHARSLLGHDAGGMERAADHFRDQGLAWFAVEAIGSATRLRAKSGEAAAAAILAERNRRMLVSRPQLRGLDLPAVGPAALTTREAEIARLAATGLTDREIGERTMISVRTVNVHLANVYRKFGVHSRTELATVLQ